MLDGDCEPALTGGETPGLIDAHRQILPWPGRGGFGRQSLFGPKGGIEGAPVTSKGAMLQDVADLDDCAEWV